MGPSKVRYRVEDVILEGRAAKRIHAEFTEGGVTDTWLDAESMLVIRRDQWLRLPDQLVLDLQARFEYNVPLEKDLFTLAPPASAKVEDLRDSPAQETVLGDTSAVVVSFEERAGTPRVTREAAVSRAATYTGLAPESVVSARYGLATDTSIPFFRVVRRPAWEVVFSGVNISVRTWQGTTKQNPNISTLTVLLDAKTGAVLKVSSPRPAAGALAAEPSPVPADTWWTHGLTLKPSAAGARVTFMQALQFAERRKATVVTEAEEVIGYLGLVTIDTDRRIRDKPCWVVFFGRVGPPVPSEPPRPPGAGPATKTKLVLSARTGECYRVSGFSPAQP